MKTRRYIAIVAILTMVLLPALTGAAKLGAVEYKSTYKRSDVSYQSSAFSVHSTAVAPTATFQSTSAYSGQLNSDPSSSLLNNDGSVNSGAYMASGPNRAKKEDVLPPNPDVDDDDSGNVPLGEGLWILALLAGGYGITRRKVNELKN